MCDACIVYAIPATKQKQHRPLYVHYTNSQRSHNKTVCTYNMNMNMCVKRECGGAEADYPGYSAFIVYSTLAACRTFDARNVRQARLTQL